MDSSWLSGCSHAGLICFLRICFSRPPLDRLRTVRCVWTFWALYSYRHIPYYGTGKPSICIASFIWCAGLTCVRNVMFQGDSLRWYLSIGSASANGSWGFITVVLVHWALVGIVSKYLGLVGKVGALITPYERGSYGRWSCYLVGKGYIPGKTKSIAIAAPSVMGPPDSFCYFIVEMCWGCT